MRKLLLATLALTAASAIAPASAAGGLYGTGTVPSGACTGGVLTLNAANSSGNNWAFNVTLACPLSTPQHVTVLGNWNAATGGPVIGFGSGSLNIGLVPCGSSGSVSVQINMVASPLVSATASITRFC